MDRRSFFAALAVALIARRLPAAEPMPSVRMIYSSTGVFDVRDYGAVVDGVTDDSPAIQRAIDAANAYGGGIVHLPGTCAVGPRVRIAARLTFPRYT